MVLQNIADDIAINKQEIENKIKVVRPSGAFFEKLPAAVVCDECHNWNPEKNDQKVNTYTGILNLVEREKDPDVGSFCNAVSL